MCYAIIGNSWSRQRGCVLTCFLLHLPSSELVFDYYQDESGIANLDRITAETMLWASDFPLP